MQVELLNIYLVCTIIMILYVSKIYINKELPKVVDDRYVKYVHIHLTTIVYYHLLIVGLILVLKPSFILDNTTASIINTCFSIMFSILFYYTDSSEVVLRHIYNALYLIFASILVAEIIVFFNLDNSYYSFVIMYMFLLINLFFYSRENRKKLLIVLSVLSTITFMTGIYNNSPLSTLSVILYLGFIVGYLYYDHDKINESEKVDYLDDALKYFLDFEGMVIRAIAGTS
jgi:hypothetical protein